MTVGDGAVVGVAGIEGEGVTFEAGRARHVAALSAVSNRTHAAAFGEVE